MKILIATDGSKNSKEMIKQYAGNTFAPNDKIRIMCAYHKSSFILKAGAPEKQKDFYAETDRRAIAEAKRAVEEAAAAMQTKHPELAITTATVPGQAKVVILEEADKFKADLIVLGSQGHGALEGFFLGSVSQAIANHAKCSVQVVRNRKKSH